MTKFLLTLNAGSSSIKFALFRAGDLAERGRGASRKGFGRSLKSSGSREAAVNPRVA
jgi:acetate kinase